ncbi:DUF4287 domain-containing protein [Luteimonas fraxinea]|nr:DUF4287 domain-containing protein [Luteimonas fraxinea]MCD9127502.1 DUF4287 domain-containing protein [Luteimonas fraxinea]
MVRAARRRGGSDRKHMEQVAFLKTGHGIGHGHANALVAFHRARAQD